MGSWPPLNNAALFRMPAMNREKFKRHLRELVHGHHHPEEHDWDSNPAARKTRAAGAGGSKPRPSRKPSAKK